MKFQNINNETVKFLDFDMIMTYMNIEVNIKATFLLLKGLLVQKIDQCCITFNCKNFKIKTIP